MDQKIPRTILLKIRSGWPDRDPEEVYMILNQYGVEENQRERDRVQLAILKLSQGQFDLLEYYLEVACSDYRDVLAGAEYPEVMKLGFTAKSQLSPTEVRSLRLRDRQQYLDWLQEGS